MNQEEFERFARSCEEAAARDPEEFRRRYLSEVRRGYTLIVGSVCGFAALGVAIAVGALVFGMSFGGLQHTAVLLLLAAVPFAFAGAILHRAHLPKAEDEPRDRVLDRAEAPALFEDLRELAGRLNVAEPGRIELLDSVNAAVSHGVPGAWSTVLFLGLPLLESIPRPLLRSVVAHELAHLHRGHGAFLRGGRVLIARLASIAREPQGQEARLPKRLRALLNERVSRLHLMAQAISRQNEFEADRLSAELEGVDTAARLLALLAVLNSVQEDRLRFTFRRQRYRDPLPPDRPLDQLLERVRELFASGDWWSRYVAAVDEIHHPGATHPTLRERLLALGFAGDAEELRSESARVRLALEALVVGSPAAESLFDETLRAKLLDRYNRIWRAELVGAWREGYAEARQAEHRVAELRAKPNPTKEERWEVCSLLAEYLEEDAIVALEEYSARYPDEALPRCQLGFEYLTMRDPRCVAHLERAAELDASRRDQSLAYLEEWHRSRGNAEELVRCGKRRAEFQEQWVRALDERAAVRSVLGALAPTMPARECDARVRAFAFESALQRIWLVRLPTKELPEMPFHAFVLEAPRAWRLANPLEWERLQLVVRYRCFPDAIALPYPAENTEAARQLQAMKLDPVWVRAH